MVNNNGKEKKGNFLTKLFGSRESREDLKIQGYLAQNGDTTSILTAGERELVTRMNLNLDDPTDRKTFEGLRGHIETQPSTVASTPEGKRQNIEIASIPVASTEEEKIAVSQTRKDEIGKSIPPFWSSSEAQRK